MLSAAKHLFDSERFFVGAQNNGVGFNLTRTGSLLTCFEARRQTLTSSHWCRIRKGIDGSEHAMSEFYAWVGCGLSWFWECLGPSPNTSRNIAGTMRGRSASALRPLAVTTLALRASLLRDTRVIRIPFGTAVLVNARHLVGGGRQMKPWRLHIGPNHIGTSAIDVPLVQLAAGISKFFLYGIVIHSEHCWGSSCL